ncbi:hypothetical protein N7528_008526 [Penicillium herquei]|nr:hypothetical protein N7528_008526 [Penicillium herquei]
MSKQVHWGSMGEGVESMSQYKKHHSIRSMLLGAIIGACMMTGYQFIQRGSDDYFGTRISPLWLGTEKHDTYSTFHQCAVKNFLETGLPFLDGVAPIQVAEYAQRRDRLAEASVAEGVDAFVVEPGYTFKYFANVSQPEWEVWEPEERPFLMIVRPVQDDHSGKISANTTFLSPAFEAERARLLGMPFTEPIQIVPWEEHWDPYQTLHQSEVFLGLNRQPRLMVDEEMRDFIQRGLSQAGFEVIGLRGHVEEVRQRKSSNEVDILRAVNTGTVEAVRQMRKCLVPGLTENQIASVLDDALRAAGMEPFFDIVLFGMIKFPNFHEC